MATINKTLLFTICVTACLITTASADDGIRMRSLNFDPPPISYPPAQYSLDSMANHPYNSATARGYAWQNPGSPKWFVPGYGYQQPYGYSSSMRNRLLNPYLQEYSFGIRRSNLRRSDATHRNWTNAYGGPWYFPGSSTNTTQRPFRW